MSRPRLLLSCVWLAVLALASGCDRLEDIFYRRAAERAALSDHDEWLTDGALHLILCGTGTPLADPTRAGGCAAVIANGKFFLIDVGPGSWENVQLWHLPRAHLRGVFLTHFHSDHIGDLGEVLTQSWIAGRHYPLDVFGPPGVVQVAGGFRAAYSLDAHYRTEHHGEEAMPVAGSAMVARTIEVPSPTESVVAYDADGVRITAFAVDHTPVAPAYGYRVEFNGRSVVISGDTKKSDNVAHQAAGTDIIVHEALAAHMLERVAGILDQRGHSLLAKFSRDIQTYHTTPVQAAEIAAQAKPKMLVLTHLVPSPPNPVVRRIFLAGVSDTWKGPVVLGEDGMHFILPGNSGEIRQEVLRRN